MRIIKTFESFNGDDLGYNQIEAGEASEKFLRRGRFAQMDKHTIDQIVSKVESISGSNLRIDDKLNSIYYRDTQSKTGVLIVAGKDEWFYVMWDIRTYNSNSTWYECDGLDAVLKCIEAISKSNYTKKTFESKGYPYTCTYVNAVIKECLIW